MERGVAPTGNVLSPSLEKLQPPMPSKMYRVPGTWEYAKPRYTLLILAIPWGRCPDCHDYVIAFNGTRRVLR